MLFCYGQLVAQWSVEGISGIRYDWNRFRNVEGNIRTANKEAFSGGFEVNRQLNKKAFQGFGFYVNSVGNTYELGGSPSFFARSLTGIRFYNSLSAHHTKQIFEIGQEKVEFGVGGQLFITRNLSEKTGSLDLNKQMPAPPFVMEEHNSGKLGISPTAFIRLNIRHVPPNFPGITAFFRTQLNVGTRALYSTRVDYNSIAHRGGGIIKNRATGLMIVYGMRLEIERKNKK
jgi:hypothetical protein